MRIFLLLSLLVVSAASALELINKSGVTIEAEIIGFDGQQVMIRRSGGQKSFTFPLNSLSDESQARVRAWGERQELMAHPHGWTTVTIHLDELRGDFSTSYSAEEFSDVTGSFQMELPKGGRIGFSLNSNDYTNAGYVNIPYSGETDWYFSSGKKGFYLKKGTSGKKELIFDLKGQADMVAREADMARISAHPTALRSMGPDKTDCRMYTGLSDLQFLWIDGRQGLEHMDTLGNCQQLQELVIEADLDKSSVLGLEKILHLKTLRSFSLSNWGRRASVTTEHLTSLANAKQLEALSLSGNCQLSDTVLQGLESLSSLKLENTMGQDSSLNLEGLPKLTDLSVDQYSVKKQSFATLMEKGHFKSLRSLLVDASYPVDNTPCLRSLTLTNGKQQVDFSHISSELDLAYVGFRSLSNAGYASIAENASLINARSAKFSSSALGQGNVIGGMKQLESLHLEYCTNLQSLDLSHATHLKYLTIYGVESLESLSLPPQLQSLTIKDTPIKQITGSPALTNLYLHKCNALEMSGFTSLPRLIKSLNTITISASQNLTETLKTPF